MWYILVCQWKHHSWLLSCHATWFPKNSHAPDTAVNTKFSPLSGLLTATLGGHMGYFLLSVLALPSSTPLDNSHSSLHNGVTSVKLALYMFASPRSSHTTPSTLSLTKSDHTEIIVTVPRPFSAFSSPTGCHRGVCHPLSLALAFWAQSGHTSVQ